MPDILSRFPVPSLPGVYEFFDNMIINESGISFNNPENLENAKLLLMNPLEIPDKLLFKITAANAIFLFPK